jgi:hypothetical protein
VAGASPKAAGGTRCKVVQRMRAIHEPATDGKNLICFTTIFWSPRAHPRHASFPESQRLRLVPVQDGRGIGVEVSNVPEQIVGAPIRAPRHIVPTRTQ